MDEGHCIQGIPERKEKYSPYNSTGYLDSIHVQLISLRARKKACLQFELNIQVAHVEVTVIDAQIEALEMEYSRVQSDLV